MSRQVRQRSEDPCSDEGSFDHAYEGDDDGQEQRLTGTKTVTNGESQIRVSFSRHRQRDHEGCSLRVRSLTRLLLLASTRHVMNLLVCVISKTLHVRVGLQEWVRVSVESAA